jgi:RNA polymerase sigma-70 factor (ECF subfamily)
VAAALRALNPERAEALALHYFAGLGFAEAGRVMGKSEEAVKKLVQRGLVELRERLERPVLSNPNAISRESSYATRKPGV